MNLVPRKLASGYRSLLKLPPPWVNEYIIDKEFMVREGTIRKNPDKDDGWLFACASLAHRIFDIGSNIGQAARLELYSASVEHVLLVDPNPLALSIAAENLILNGLCDRASFERSFISDNPSEEIEFFTVATGAAGSMFKQHAKTASRRGLHYKVHTNTIDKLVEKYGVPDFIKIDIEGAESFALRGASYCMRQHKTRFLVEMHSNPDLPMSINAQKVKSICESVGYSAWYLSKNQELISADQLSTRGRCHLLLQPNDWAWPKIITKIAEYTPVDAALRSSVMVNNHH